MSRKVLISYVREERTKAPVAVMAVGPNNHVGIALCHENDRFTKQRGVHIATQRALNGADFKAEGDNVNARRLNGSKLLTVIELRANRLRARGQRYFQTPVEVTT